MSKLTLNIVTPNGSYGPITCDSVHLTVCDNEYGKGGGSYGIRDGHTKALLSLDTGVIDAYALGKKIFEAECGPGFATVEHNSVTAIVEQYIEK